MDEPTPPPSPGADPERPGSGSAAPHTTIDPAEVEEVVGIMRPVIQADGGDIALVGIDSATGVVTVELQGACVSCPASTITMKAGIERIMKDRVPGVTSVVQSGGEAPIEGSGSS